MREDREKSLEKKFLYMTLGALFLLPVVFVVVFSVEVILLSLFHFRHPETLAVSFGYAGGLAVVANAERAGRWLEPRLRRALKRLGEFLVNRVHRGLLGSLPEELRVFIYLFSFPFILFLIFLYFWLSALL